MSDTENIDTLQKQLNAVSQECDFVKKELGELKKEYLELVGRVDEHTEFIEELKSECVNETISEDTLMSSEPTYFEKLNEYFISNDKTLVPELFENFDTEKKQVLTDIRNSLPPNIDNLAKKYDCYEELKVLRKSNKHIAKFKKEDKFFNERGLSDIISEYIRSFNKDKKRVPLKFLKQALMYYPLQFNSFLEDIKAYRCENFNIEVKKIWRELYGEMSFNMNISGDDIDDIEDDGTACDFKNMPPEELAETLSNYKFDPRRRVGRMIRNMKKSDRSYMEIKKFVKSVNKQYGLNYPYPKK